MFELIRNHKRWMLFLVLILILPSFVFFGIEGYSRFMAGDQALATVDGEPITRAEYDAARRAQLDRGRQMLGASFNPALFDTPDARRQTLEQLIDARVLTQAMADGMFTVSDNAVRQAIAQTPAVQRDGRFDSQLYAEILASQGMTPASFEAGLRYELARNQVLEPVAVSGMVPGTLVVDLLAALERERTIRLRRFEIADNFDTVEVTDAEVESYYQANADRFQVPETIDVEYLVLDSAAVLADVQVSDDDIKQYYEQNKQRFTNEARRRVSHILIEDGGDAEAAKAKAQELADRLRSEPGRFADLARDESADRGSANQGGSLGWITRGALVPEFEEVAFSLPAGQVSDPVRTEFGWHLILVEEAQDAAIKPLEEVREQLADEIRMQKAGARFGEMASQLTNLVYDQAESLEPAADTLGLKIRQVDGVRRDGAPSGAPELFADQRVLLSLFSADVMREGRNSGVIELAPDNLVVVRAREVHPAHLAPLADVEGQIREILRRERALAAAREAGEALLQQLQQGGAAADAGFGPEMQVSRAAPAALPPEVIEGVMGVVSDAELPVYLGASAGSAYVVAEVSAIAALPEPAATTVDSERTALANAQGEAETRGVLQLLRRHYDVKVDPYAERVVNEGDEVM